VSLAWLPVSLSNLIRLLAARRIHVINCHYLTEYFLHLVLAGRLMRIPVIISVHGADVDRYASAGAAQRLILQLIMRGANVIVACSAAMARQTADVFPFANWKITHVHNGLHSDDLELGVSVMSIKTRFVLCVARQVNKKGIDTLLRAFALLRHDFPDLE